MAHHSYACRIDENQPGIVKGLMDRVVAVQVLSGIGAGVPDLLIGYRGRNYLVEIKDPAKELARRRLTPLQAGWHMKWHGRGQVDVCETLEQVLEVIGYSSEAR